MFSALIIDADSSARSAIQSALSQYGFQFDFRDDASDGVAHARNQAPDVIFLRVELPSASGFSVCNKLRRNDETKYIPLVMYAAEVADDVFEQHRNLRTHADGYLRMPLDAQELVSTVGQIMTLPEPGAGDVDELEVEIEDDLAEGADEPAEAQAADDSEVEAVSEPGTPTPLKLSTDAEGDLAAETDAAFAALRDGEEEPLDAAEAAGAPGGAAAEEEAVAEPRDAGDGDGEGIEIDDDLMLDRSGSGEGAPGEELDVDADFDLPTDLDDLDDEVGDEPSPASTDAPPDDDGGDVDVAAEVEAELGESSEPTTETADATEPVDDDDAMNLDQEFEERRLPAKGISARRETLNLKAQLVSRDRAMLKLKDEVETQKRAVLDTEHRARELEGEVSELQEKLLSAEDQSLTAQETADAAISDKKTLLKREEGLKIRLDVQQKKAQKLEKELRGLEAATAQAKAEQEKQLADVHEQLQGYVVEREELQTEFQRVQSELSERRQAATSHEEQAEAMANENKRLSEAVTAVGEELSEVKTQAEADFLAAQEQSDKELEEKLAKQADEHQAQMEFQEKEGQRRLQKRTGEWEEQRDAFQTALDEANGQITELQRERGDLTQELVSMKHEHAEALEQKDQAAAADKDQLETRIRGLEGSVGELEGELANVQQLARDKGEAVRKAQQALAVALRVLD